MPATTGARLALMAASKASAWEPYAVPLGWKIRIVRSSARVVLAGSCSACRPRAWSKASVILSDPNAELKTHGECWAMGSLM